MVLNKKNKEIILKILKFSFWGLITTVLNVALYYIFRYIKIPVAVSTILAWLLCVSFAFITNKRYVFNKTNYEKQQIVREIILFYGSRLFSGIMDVLLMVLMVNILSWNEILSKVMDEVAVSTFNFVFSFLVIFKQKNTEKETK